MSLQPPLRAIVTGAAGFLGARLAARLAADPRLAGVTGLDRVAGTDPAVPVVAADIARFAEAAPPAGLVLHAAAITTQASEADPDAAYAINVEGMRAVLRWARAQPSPPRIVFLSSVAVFGAGDAVATESTPPDPRSAYGTTKLIAERLLLDATRRGEVEGRILRLPVIIVRTGARTAPPGAGFASAAIDAALRGLPCLVPFAPGHALPVASLEAALGLATRVALEEVPARLLHLPSLAASADSVRAALARCGVPAPAIDCAPDAAQEALVAGWPSRLGTEHPGFAAPFADETLDAVIRAYAARLPRSGEDQAS